MEMTTLNNDVEYARAVERLEEIFDGPMTPKDKDEFNQLTSMIEVYELANFSLVTENQV